MICLVDACIQPVRARGYCANHYQRLRLLGDPVGSYGPRGPRPVPEIERFHSYIDKSQDCWVWTGSRHPFGYGKFSIKRGGRWKMVSAHVYMMSDVEGHDVEGLQVLHACDNPPCVNPAHLVVGTHAENMRHVAERGRWLTPGRAAAISARRARPIAHGTTAGEYNRCRRRQQGSCNACKAVVASYQRKRKALTP